jgi:hypothetical protein
MIVLLCGVLLALITLLPARPTLARLWQAQRRSRLTELQSAVR